MTLTTDATRLLQQLHRALSDDRIVVDSDVIPHVFTYERYLSQSDHGDASPAATLGWLGHASADRRQLDASEIETDREALDQGTKVARDWTNRGVTHRDKDTVTSPVSQAFADLNQCLDHLGAVVQRYYGLYNPGSTLYAVTPYLPQTWINMFAVSWLSDDFQPVDPDSLG